MKIKVIINYDHYVFQQQVNDFLKINQELIFHDKTTFGITNKTEMKVGRPTKRLIPQYSVIFYMEGN